jgi:HK97 family phage portal protein
VQGQEIEPARIVHFKYYDPLNPYVGVSPISSAYRSLYAEEGAAEWNQALLDNYAQPSGILSTDATLVPDDRNSLREELLREYTGAERFNPMVLWGGLKWQQLTLNPVDMQFLEQKNQNKEEICAILNTPAILVGAVADPNHSNAGHARLSFWEDRVDPVLTSIQSKLDAELVKPYYGEDLELRYDISNVPAFRKALAEKANIAKVFVGMGFPANDVNDKLRLGLEPTPWGDVAWMPSTVMPVDEDGIERLIAEDPADAATKPKPGTKPSDDEDDGTTEPQRGVDPEDDEDPDNTLEK